MPSSADTTTESVLLLHPLGGDRLFWSPLAAAAPHLDLIAVDLPGHGHEPTVPGDTIGTIADRLATRLTRSGRGPVHVVGISLGGLIAQRLAVAAPELVSTLVLVDTVATYPDQWRQQWRARAEQVGTAGPDMFLKPSLATWFSQEYLDAPGPGVAYLEASLGRTSPTGYAAACHVLAAADQRATTADIAVPTLIVCGTDDAPVFQESGTWLAANIPNATLCTIEGRHAAVYENADQFAAMLTAFYNSVG